METEDELVDFTLAEAMEMTTLFKGLKGKPITLEFCQELANKFKKYNDTYGYTRLPDCAYDMPQRPKVSAAEMAKELSGLAFEALSAKDLAWYDVASFLNFRVLYSGELEVRVRFAGFGHEEDEWVNVKRGVRECSVPLEPSECGRLNVGDPVMCFREDEYLAVYGDTMIADIQRNLHDNTRCTCIFVVCYDLDKAEAKVALDKICCRPNFSNNDNNLSSEIPQEGSEDGKMDVDSCQ